MKLFQLALALLLLLAVAPPSAHAQIYSVQVNAATTNIPTSFGSGSDSRVIRNISNVRGIVVNSEIGTRIVVNCGSDSVTPSDTSSANIYVPGNGAIAIDNSYLGNTCYIRSDGSALVTGVVQIHLIGG